MIRQLHQRRQLRPSSLLGRQQQLRASTCTRRSRKQSALYYRPSSTATATAATRIKAIIRSSRFGGAGVPQCSRAPLFFRSSSLATTANFSSLSWPSSSSSSFYPPANSVWNGVATASTTTRNNRSYSSSKTTGSWLSSSSKDIGRSFAVESWWWNASKVPKGFEDFFPDGKVVKKQPGDKSKQTSSTTTSSDGISDKQETTAFASRNKQQDEQKQKKSRKETPPPPPNMGDDTANLPGLIALLALILMIRQYTENNQDGDKELGQEITFQEFRNQFLQQNAVEKLLVINQKVVQVILKPEAQVAVGTNSEQHWSSSSHDANENATTATTRTAHTSSSSSPVESVHFEGGGRGPTTVTTTGANGNNNRNNKYYFYIGSVESFEEKLTKAQSHDNRHPEDWIDVQYVNRTNWGLEFLKTLPFLAFVAAVYFGSRGVMSSMGGGGVGGRGGGAGGGIFSIGKSNAKKISKEDVNVNFSDVAGCDEAKKEIMEFVDFLKDSSRFTKLGAKIPKGALLCGPPGTGKTLLAKAVAGEAGVPFYSISGSDFIEMFVGVGPSRVRDMFKEARQNAPCIVFIDEIDAVGRQRGRGGFSGGNDERENTLNQLLVEMDGFSPTTGVVVLAGTNRVDILDQALTRPGRFDRQVLVDRPDLKGRKEIFEVHLKNITLAGEMEEYAGRLAGLTPGFAGADIANICNEAAIVAARRKAEAVDMEDFEKAVDRIIGGLESNKIMSEEERSIVAHHEAGHAIAGWFLEHADPLLKVTIIPRTSGALGFAQYLPKEVFLRSQDQIMDIVCMALAGRASEEVFFGRVTTGASDDLRRVTQLVYSMIKDYGMNSKVGQLAFSSDRETIGDKPYSDSTAEAMDEEARMIVDAAYQRTVDLIRERKDEVEKLAKLLLDKETITHDDIVDLVGPRPFQSDSAYQEYVSSRKDKKPTEEDKKEEDEEESTPLGGLSPGLA